MCESQEMEGELPLCVELLAGRQRGTVETLQVRNIYIQSLQIPGGKTEENYLQASVITSNKYNRILKKREISQIRIGMMLVLMQQFNNVDNMTCTVLYIES